MPDTKLRPTSKESAVWIPQKAIHIWLSFVLNYVHKWKKTKTKKLKFRLFTWGFLGFYNLKTNIRIFWDFKAFKNLKTLGFSKPTATALFDINAGP